MRPLTGLLLLTGLALTSCSKSGDDVSAVVKFSELAKSVKESDGQVSLGVSLGSVTTEDVVLQFSVTGTAVLNGDYIMQTTTDSTLTIPKGSSSSNIVLKLINDKAIESTKTIEITLKAISSGHTLSTNALDLTGTISVEDDDTAPTDGIQVDLTWDKGSKAEMDLYLLTGVEFDADGNILNADQTNSLSSVNEEGFQTVSLPSSAPDGSYYVVVEYYQGNRDINYVVNINGASYTNVSGGGSFTSSQVGYYTYRNSAIVKSGSAYTLDAGGTSRVLGKPVRQLLKVTRKEL